MARPLPSTSLHSFHGHLLYRELKTVMNREKETNYTNKSGSDEESLKCPNPLPVKEPEAAVPGPRAAAHGGGRASAPAHHSRNP